MSPRLVFDLGGVLVRIHRSWASVLAARGRLVLDRHQNGHSDFPLFDPFQAGLVSEADYLACLAVYLEVEPELAPVLHDEILIEPYPDTRELVEQIHARGLQTACLSNTNVRHWSILRDPAHYPAIAALQVGVGSQQHGFVKPDPALFRAFEIAVPSESGYLLFDDSELNVTAARELGWDAVLIDWAGDTAAQIQTSLIDRSML